MSDLQYYKYGILASLKYGPGTFEEIKEREFLRSVARSSMGDYAIDSWLRDLMRENLIYRKGETYYAYKTRWVEQTLDKYGFND